jgi:thiol-disulfide isomerase/thioredoxin
MNIRKLNNLKDKMKNTSKYLLVAAFSFLALWSSACSQETKTAVKPIPGFENGVYLPTGISATGEKEPLDFTWEENGKTMKFSSLLKGKVTFLNFWGTWCPPCRAEIPHLIDLNKEYQSKGFNIVGFALERQGDPVENVKGFVNRTGINYRNFPSRDYADAFAKKFGAIQFVPTTFVVGLDGKILETIVGGKDKAGFEEIIKKYIGTN